ncbi:MAG TPA: MBL fold metallo-hydrolase [Bryobacteraceae bacterium]|nr:MBL fold metallo-hydrolase [Bryobacteraceae bacterium]
MKLTFLGSRGEIDLRTRQHRMHSALVVSWRRARIMIDCGDDWLGRLGTVKRDAILITHAHTDHAGALKHGAPCPVYATAESWKVFGGRPVASRAVIEYRAQFSIGGVRFEAFALDHSLRAPAAGFRISTGDANVFYSPDVARIHHLHQAFAGLRL